MEGIDITCPKCQVSWTYKGKKLAALKNGVAVYVTCPTCHYNVKIEEES